jgi:parallel beta-helix repeat protein
MPVGNRRTRHTAARRLPWLLLAALLLPALLSGCSNEPTQTSRPTVVTLTPTAPTAAPSLSPAVPTPRITQPAVAWQRLSDYGILASGQTLLLPDGQWYDTGNATELDSITGLTLTSSGPGRPTLSRPSETKPLLTLTDCSEITFSQVRFGYDRTDWPDGTASNEIPLVALNNCTKIRFENCIFYGGGGPGLLLSGSENIVLADCTFYNLAGQPIETGPAYLPSQIRCSACTFETIGSGLLPLYLRDSLFDECTWIGRRGYAVPVFAADGDAADLNGATLTRTLPGQLVGLLAARIRYHSDDQLAITCRNTFFCSNEVVQLFSQLEQSLPAVLPSAVQSWALTGQKQEEAVGSLDPALGLRLNLRVETGSGAIASLAPSASPAPGGSGTAQPTPAGTDSLYDIDRLLADLSPLQDLSKHLPVLLSGHIRLVLSDQEQKSLLVCAIPIEGFPAALSGTAELAKADILLLNPQLIPARFYRQPAAGQLAARDLQPLLRDALKAGSSPLVLYLAGNETRFLENKLTYLGTRLEESIGRHTFSLQIWHTGSGAVGPAWQLVSFADLSIRADNGQKSEITADGTLRPVQLPDDQQRLIILAALAEPVLVTGTGQPGDLHLHRLADWSAEGDDYTPILIYEASQSTLVCRIALYDEAGQPWPVSVKLALRDGVWQVESVDWP